MDPQTQLFTSYTPKHFDPDLDPPRVSASAPRSNPYNQPNSPYTTTATKLATASLVRNWPTKQKPRYSFYPPSPVATRYPGHVYYSQPSPHDLERWYRSSSIYGVQNSKPTPKPTSNSQSPKSPTATTMITGTGIPGGGGALAPTSSESPSPSNLNICSISSNLIIAFLISMTLESSISPAFGPVELGKSVGVWVGVVYTVLRFFVDVVEEERGGVLFWAGVGCWVFGREVVAVVCAWVWGVWGVRWAVGEFSMPLARAVWGFFKGMVGVLRVWYSDFCHWVWCVLERNAWRAVVVVLGLHVLVSMAGEYYGQVGGGVAVFVNGRRVYT